MKLENNLVNQVSRQMLKREKKESMLESWLKNMESKERNKMVK